jgi:SAM-dependent methyltransferase
MAQAQPNKPHEGSLPNPNHEQIISPHPSKRIVEQSYDKIAPVYLKWTSPFPSSRITYLNKLLLLLPPSTSCSVLELGCGAGVPCTQMLAQHASSLIAVDISTTQLELARQNVRMEEGAGKLEFVKSDMHELSFSEGTFNAVVGFYSIIHLPRGEQVVLMKKIWSWLIPGGYFLANFAAIASEESWMESWLVEGSGMFWSSWDERGSLEMVRGAGFEVLEGRVVWEDEGSIGGSSVGFLWVLGRKVIETDGGGMGEENEEGNGRGSE